MQLQIDSADCRGVAVENIFGQQREYRPEGKSPVITVPADDAASLLANAPNVSRYRKSYNMGVSLVNGRWVRE
jgi:hypothetical protein